MAKRETRPAEGWYPDPGGAASTERFYDGSAWTEQLRPAVVVPNFAPPPVASPPRKKRRVFTWVILAINAAFLVWLITGIAHGAGPGKNCGQLSQQTCTSAQHVGTGIAVVLILVLWAVVDVILGVVYLVTRRR